MAREPTAATMGPDLDRTCAVWKQVGAVVIDPTDQGWLRGETGIGTFVADQPPTDL